MYTKTKTSGLAIALVFLFGALTIISPKNIYADTSAETNATVEFEAGELLLEDVVTLDFGEQKISATSENYAAETAGSKIQVSDLRGTGEGWNLEVSLSEFTSTDNKKLSGAYITIKDAEVINVHDSLSAEPNLASAPIKIDSDKESVSIFAAAADAGMGAWRLLLDPADIELTVLPGTAYAVEYQADLSWALQATP